MALTKEQEAIYYAAEKADKNFQEELVRLYGKKAGDMRYRPTLWTDRKLKAAALRARRATDRWLKVMKSVGSVRRSNPSSAHFGPKEPYEDFARWGPGETRYVEDAEGRLWAGSPRGWSRIPGTRQTAERDIRAGTWKYHAELIREKNPGPHSVHTKAWDRCVKEVKAKGTATDPYAVCTAAMGEMAIRKPHRRAANPLPKVTSVRRIFYAVTASRGHEHLYLKRNGKLTRNAADAARFNSVNEATAKANAHLRRYPVSRAYRFSVGLAY